MLMLVLLNGWELFLYTYSNGEKFFLWLVDWRENGMDSSLAGRLVGWLAGRLERE